MPLPRYPETAPAIPALTTDQMVEVDRLMIEEYGISLMQMMENAGRALATVAREVFLDGSPGGKQVVVLAGSGGNGGGAMVAARRLATWGADVEVCVTRDPEHLREVSLHQHDILQALDIPIFYGDEHPESIQTADLILDGIIGYSLGGSPQGVPANLIRWANAQAAPVLSLDTPSGVDLTTGTAHEDAVRAAATLTLALPKVSLLADEVLPYCGDLYLADISVPPVLYSAPRLDLEVPAIFSKWDVLQIG